MSLRINHTSRQVVDPIDTDRRPGCWELCKGRIVSVKNAGVGLASRVGSRIVNFARSRISSFNCQKVLAPISQTFRDNWSVAVKGLHNHKNTIILTGIELGSFAIFYAAGRPLDGPCYSLVVQLAFHTFPASLMQLSPQDDPEVLPVRKTIASLQGQSPIAKPIHIHLSDQYSCTGYAKGSTGQIVINVPKAQAGHTEKNLFAIAHEYAHASNNDPLSGPLIKCGMRVCAIPIFLLLSSQSPSLIKQSIQYALSMKGIGMISDYASMNFFERRADKRALEFEPKAEIRAAAIDYFTKIQLNNLTFRSKDEKIFLNRLWNRLFITPSGNFLLDWEHPFLTSRLKMATSSRV